MKITKYIVTTYKYGHGGTPKKEFHDYEKALNYFNSQKGDWDSVELKKVEEKQLHYFACEEEQKVSRKMGEINE